MGNIPSVTEFSEKEFSTLRLKLAKADLAQTHRHNLVRADEIVGNLAGPAFVDFQSPRQADYIRALLENRPSLAFPDSSGFTPIPGTDMDRLLEGGKPTINFERAVTCPLQRCYVGSALNGDGFIEIIGTSKEVAQIRFVYNMHLSGGNLFGDQGARTHNTSEEESYIANMIQMFRLFAYLQSENAAKGVEVALNDSASMEAMIVAGYLRDSLFQCGIGSQEIRRGGLQYRSESLTKRGWMEITVRAANQNDQLSSDEHQRDAVFESYRQDINHKMNYLSNFLNNEHQQGSGASSGDAQIPDNKGKSPPQ